jgi:molybdenum cofactor guanylyltransferase
VPSSSIPSSSDKTAAQHISAIILAGGEGSRVDFNDKGLLQWRDRALVDHVIECIRPQVDDLVISANRHIEQYQTRGFHVVEDLLPDFAGPLAGIAACHTHINSDFVLTVPCDMPLLPADLVSRLRIAIGQGNTDCAVARDGTYSQYLVALYRNTALLALPDALRDGIRAVRQWQKRIHTVTVDFADEATCFGNFNTIGQLD